jgi:hypothetical protein
VQRFSLILALLAWSGVTGCAPSASQKLVGKWEYDVLHRAQQGSGKQDGGGVKQTILGLAQAAGVKVGMEIEFKGDQTVTMSASAVGTATSGPMHWKVTKADGQTATVEIRRPNEESPRKLQITFVDEDHIRLAPPGTGDESLLFTRVKQE